MRPLIDLTGQHFGALAVIRRAGLRRNGATWLCRCSCGREIVCEGSNLRRGKSRSCGHPPRHRDLRNLSLDEEA